MKAILTVLAALCLCAPAHADGKGRARAALALADDLKPKTPVKPAPKAECDCAKNCGCPGSKGGPCGCGAQRKWTDCGKSCCCGCNDGAPCRCGDNSEASPVRAAPPPPVVSTEAAVGDVDKRRRYAPTPPRPRAPVSDRRHTQWPQGYSQPRPMQMPLGPMYPAGRPAPSCPT